jgi:hypothetical protein
MFRGKGPPGCPSLGPFANSCRRDIERVERALAADGELAQRYELVREELAETIALNEKLGAPSARAMRNCSLRSMLRRPVPRARGIIALAEHRAWRQPRPKLCAQPRGCGCLRNAPQAE